MKILIIEPHADDALIACYTLLSKLPENSIDILTCCTHEDGRSSKLLNQEIKSIDKVITLPYSEKNYLWDSRMFTYMQIARSSQSLNLYELQVANVENRYTYKEDCTNMIDDISKVLKSCEYDFVFIPFGLIHPYHILTTLASFKSLVFYPKDKIQIYFELEHYNKKSVRDHIIPGGLKYWGNQLNPKLKSYQSEYNTDAKYFIFKKVYPSEMHLMRGDKRGHLYGEIFLIIPEFRKYIDQIDSQEE